MHMFVVHLLIMTRTLCKLLLSASQFSVRGCSSTFCTTHTQNAKGDRCTVTVENTP